MQTNSKPAPYIPANLEEYAPWVAKLGLRAPYGECQCGCGQKTNISKKTVNEKRWRRQHPIPFVRGHSRRVVGGRKPPPPVEYASWVEQYGLSEPYGKCQCGCGEDAPLATLTNPQFGHAKGHPVRFVYNHHGRGQSMIDRFWEKVDRRGFDECWLWKGGKTKTGYGGFWTGERQDMAHRVSYELHYGPIPEGHYVCHHCDNPPCCNPYHLFEGTPTDNVQDMISKGRRMQSK